jgi:hypothetical protein
MAGYCFRVAITFKALKRPRINTEYLKNRL